METTSSELLHSSDFEPYLNQVFQIRFTVEITLPAELINVTEIPGYTTVDRKPFSILFRTAQKTEYFRQSVCILQHPVKGEVPVFLVPLGLDEEGMRYEAVFS
ncbi:MAG: hypothetical protein IPP15_06840 [Saprospiraceae bacterium]|uniref:DUF6916 domain-containing protein n=1 Tax=Candidatus Opimibacter skivensis TaxID=2982028 RepID=A0A9D7SU57_9BACT|nr:hypothetical protein [Candidatus Opimibacter skivensis]